MSEAPQSPVGAYGYLNAPGLIALDNTPRPATLHLLPLLHIPYTTNAPIPPIIETLKAPNLSVLMSTIQPLNKEKGNWTNWSHIMTWIYQIWIDKCCILNLMKVKEGDNIQEHLMKVKKQWETIKLFNKEQYHKVFNNTLFKKAIIISLPYSWDTFCANYVKCFLDKDPESIDARKCIDAQELLGTISQEYT